MTDAKAKAAAQGARQRHAARPGPDDNQPRYHHGDLRAALIAAAEDLIAENGMEGFTLRECARRAGVSAAAPAHHFGNSRGLLEAIAILGFDELSDSMEAHVASISLSMPSKRVRATGEAYVRFALRRPGRFKATFGRVVRPSTSSNPALKAASDRAFRILQREVAGLPSCREGSTAITPRAVLTWSLVHGLANLLLDQRLGFLSQGTDAADPLTELAASVLDQFERCCAS